MILDHTYHDAADLQVLTKDINKPEKSITGYVRIACQFSVCVLNNVAYAHYLLFKVIQPAIKTILGDVKELKNVLHTKECNVGIIYLHLRVMHLFVHTLHLVTSGRLPNLATIRMWTHLALANSQLKLKDRPFSTSRAIIAITVSAFVVAYALKFFEWWWKTYGPYAPTISLDTNYAHDILYAYRSNAVFSQFICPITYSPIRFPVMAPSTPGHPGHCFERRAIITWLARSRTNPLNMQPLYLYQLTETGDARRAIEDEMQKLKIPFK